MNNTVLNNPIPEEWGAHVTQIANGVLERIPYIAYFKATYVTGTTGNVLPFFNAVPASDAISNINQPGLLPSGQSLLIKSIQVHIENGIETQLQGAADAVVTSIPEDAFLIAEGVLRCTLGTKPQGPWPIHRLPSPSGANVSAIGAAGTAAASLVTMQADLVGSPYMLEPKLLIANLQPFQFSMAWAAALTLSIANKNIWLMLDGELARPIG